MFISESQVKELPKISRILPSRPININGKNIKCYTHTHTQSRIMLLALIVPRQCNGYVKEQKKAVIRNKNKLSTDTEAYTPTG